MIWILLMMVSFRTHHDAWTDALLIVLKKLKEVTQKRYVA